MIDHVINEDVRNVRPIGPLFRADFSKLMLLLEIFDGGGTSYSLYSIYGLPTAYQTTCCSKQWWKVVDKTEQVPA